MTIPCPHDDCEGILLASQDGHHYCGRCMRCVGVDTVHCAAQKREASLTAERDALKTELAATKTKGSGAAGYVAGLEADRRKLGHIRDALTSAGRFAGFSGVVDDCRGIIAERDALAARFDSEGTSLDMIGSNLKWQERCDELSQRCGDLKRELASAESARDLAVAKLGEVIQRRDRGLERNALLEQAVAWLRKRGNVLENEATEWVQRYRSLHFAYDRRVKQLTAAEQALRALRGACREAVKYAQPAVSGACSNHNGNRCGSCELCVADDALDTLSEVLADAAPKETENKITPCPKCGVPGESCREDTELECPECRCEWTEIEPSLDSYRDGGGEP